MQTNWNLLQCHNRIQLNQQMKTRNSSEFSGQQLNRVLLMKWRQKPKTTKQIKEDQWMAFNGMNPKI